MYDPESELRTERALERLRIQAEDNSRKFGENNIVTMSSKIWLESAETLSSMKNDHDNCFDETEREEKKKDILKTIDAIIYGIIEILEAAGENPSEE